MQYCLWLVNTPWTARFAVLRDRRNSRSKRRSRSVSRRQPRSGIQSVSSLCACGGAQYWFCRQPTPRSNRIDILYGCILLDAKWFQSFTARRWKSFGVSRPLPVPTNQSLPSLAQCGSCDETQHCVLNAFLNCRHTTTNNKNDGPASQLGKGRLCRAQVRVRDGLRAGRTAEEGQRGGRGAVRARAGAVWRPARDPTWLHHHLGVSSGPG